MTFVEKHPGQEMDWDCTLTENTKIRFCVSGPEIAWDTIYASITSKAWISGPERGWDNIKGSAKHCKCPPILKLFLSKIKTTPSDFRTWDWVGFILRLKHWRRATDHILWSSKGTNLVLYPRNPTLSQTILYIWYFYALSASDAYIIVPQVMPVEKFSVWGKKGLKIWKILPWHMYDIFGYSLVSNYWYECICIKIIYSPHPVICMYVDIYVLFRWITKYNRKQTSAMHARAT